VKKEMRIEFQVIGILIILIIGGKLILWPLLADVHFRKGLKAESAIEYEKAETEFKIAINYSKNPVYYENLASLYCKMGEAAKNRQKGRRHYEQSIYFYKKLLGLKPKSALVYNGLGATCLYIGRDFKDEEFYKSAIFNFKEAIKLEPKFIDAYINLATAYYLWGLKDKAINAYKEALKGNPDNISIHFNLGMLYYLEKDYGKAEKQWKKVLELDPDNLDAQRGIQMINKIKVKR